VTKRICNEQPFRTPFCSRIAIIAVGKGASMTVVTAVTAFVCAHPSTFEDHVVHVDGDVFFVDGWFFSGWSSFDMTISME